MNKYNVNDIVFFISNGYHIREATVIRAGEFCTIKFNDNETPAGTRVRESKLFKTKQEAEIVVEKHITHCYTRHCWMNHKSYPNNYSSNLTYSLSWHSTLSADSFLFFFSFNVIFTLDCYTECRRS